MKLGFYPRLAADGIRKNRRMYLPYILTCVGMVMMFYIILYLAVSPSLDAVKGADTLREIFALGSWVIAVFSAIFLFYTNSFLMRRRRREFGLYNILGMGKGNIARILIWETVWTAILSIGFGLFAGIALSKLAELGLVNVMRGEVTFDLTVSHVSIVRTAEVFGVIFVLLLLNSIRQVRFASAVSLLRSENAGEKPPRGNLLLGAAGVLLLAAAYTLAVSIKNPLAALLWFFVAVLMVIIGTYLVIIAGSVLFCRLLQRKKSYYYQASHFVSVSSMVYRMKRNGAGLASICVLATMVLVMISSTTCLYFGEEASVSQRYPRELSLTATFTDERGSSADPVKPLREAIVSIAEGHGAELSDVCDYRYLNVSGAFMPDGEVETDADRLDSFSASTLGNVTAFCFIPLADYNAMTGENRTLEDGQALIYAYRTSFDGDTLTFKRGLSLRIAGTADNFPGSGSAAMDVVPTVFLVVPDLYDAMEQLVEGMSEETEQYLVMRWLFQFDTGLNAEGQQALCKELRAKLREGGEQLIHFEGVTVGAIECRELERDEIFGLFGSLFYLGVILSIVFILAAVLIIYYKQISEGYEDQARFDIMRKVGMTKREIRKSINSQLLTVFFLPLLLAALHICFAFPIIEKLLRLFGLNNVSLFALTTALSAAVFALFYAAVYRLTSNAYYNIVSGAREAG